jgi:hypothetical protein
MRKAKKERRKASHVQRPRLVFSPSHPFLCEEKKNPTRKKKKANRYAASAVPHALCIAQKSIIDFGVHIRGIKAG